MFKEYSLKARLTPTILAAPPILILGNALFDLQSSQWLDSDMMISLFGKGSASTALVFFMIQVNRLIGLEIFQRWAAKDELDLPTTRFLLEGNLEMSSAQRADINQKIQRDFQVSLLPEIHGDTPIIRRHNADIVARIRNFVGSPPKLLQYNIEYGFFRNLIGASVPAIMASLGNIYLYEQGLLPIWAYELSIAYAICAGTLISLAKPIIQRLGVMYARMLFLAYLAKT